MAKEHKSVRRDIDDSIAHDVGRGSPGRIQTEYPVSQVLSVEVITEQVKDKAAQSGDSGAHGMGLYNSENPGGLSS